MPAYDLIADPVARKRTKAALADCNVTLDLVYPFMVTGRSQPDEFAPAMGAASDLGAKTINLLVYDRDEARRIDTVDKIVRMAAVRGMNAVIEFYP